MTRAALESLLERVEAGEASTMGFEDAGFDGWAELAYHGSLDAAKALHEAALPGWEWWLNSMNYWDGGEGPTCILRIGAPMVDLRVASARSDTPARAWLIAIIRAMLAEGE